MKLRRRTPSFDDLRRRAIEVAEALYGELPDRLRQTAAQVPLVVDGTPGEDLIQSGVAPETLGLFVGDVFGSEGGAGPPPQIILFVENLWAASGGDDAVFREEVRRTLLHELGHYLGLDEGELFQRDLD